MPTAMKVCEPNAATAAAFALPEDSRLFDDYPDLLTPTHIAELTGFTVQYVRRLCRERRLPAVQIGARQWFVPKPRFIEYVNGGGIG